MANIDINDPIQRSGAVYFVVGRGTEGGNSSYRLSVAGVTPSQWGDLSKVADNSGYSIGTIQVDLGQRGTWPLGSIAGRPLKAGETTYVDAVIAEAAAYAKANKHPFPGNAAGLSALRQDLLSHGNGEGNNPSIRFIAAEHRDTINAWASSQEGQQWIHRHIDFPQVQAIADDAKDALDHHGSRIPDDRKLEVMCVLAKAENQRPKTYNKLVAALRDGADYERFMQAVDQQKAAVSYFAGPKAGELARQYQENFQKPGNAVAMEAAPPGRQRPLPPFGGAPHPRDPDRPRRLPARCQRPLGARPRGPGQRGPAAAAGLAAQRQGSQGRQRFRRRHRAPAH